MAPDTETHRIRIHLDDVLSARGMTLTALAEAVGMTLANVSILKNNRAKAIRFSTLTAICDVLGCQPGDIISVEPTRTPVTTPRH
ncbi:putative transcriptional regulator [Kineococcus xinjiangensis]|uniref:Putative transcriptional regulator n=1 Tax=Kineococcus xinjiangensis TaxID=512762 RepID=A0A2S6ID87_9ACTN|nr:helix-turn-helix transcriptional regulator [Kineococcus xinjiangensis]PPK92130.1 putative transcriptional regulator [Kineococcus xinjiangensis]